MGRKPKGTGPQVPIGFRIDPDLHVRLKVEVAFQDQSMADIISRAIEEYLERQEMDRLNVRIAAFRIAEASLFDAAQEVIADVRAHFPELLGNEPAQSD